MAKKLWMILMITAVIACLASPSPTWAGRDNVVAVGSVKGVATPKGTPPEVTRYLSERFKKVCDDPEFVKAMKDIGQPVMYQGPEGFAKYMKDGFAQFGQMIKEFNIKLE